MPFFNFRRASSAPSNSSAGQPESMEVVRKRAKHRLIGSAVLVLAGVVGFPLLFDTQPRPISVDNPIEIPGKNSVKPLLMPAKPEPATVSSPSGTAAVAASSSLTPKEEIITEKGPVSPPVVAVAPVLPSQAAPKTEAKPEPKAQPKPEAKLEPKPEVRPEAKPEPKPVAKADDGARAKALLDGQTAAAPATPATSGEDRLVVQVGAFADADKAKEVRQKLEKAGLKTYTQVAETKDGKRIRVRVGPFASKAEADKAATKIKALDLPAAILTL
ncbi:MAG: SPOR domain-containing protein [Vitreoscilla sp.]|nr:SPOR domain-containing protein [Polaromonas sp.]